MDPARLSRLRLVLTHARLRPVDDPEPILSYSNDTWAFTDERWGRCILRVCYRGDVRRLTREALLCRELGRTVRVPSVLAVGEVDVPREREVLGTVAAAGEAETLTWTLTSRLDGRQLVDAWPGLEEAQRRDAVSQLAEQLRALHAWRPDAMSFAALQAEWTPGSGDDTAELVGRSMNPLPDDVQPLIERMAERRVPDGLVAATRRLFADADRMRDELDNPARHGLTHADLHLDNVWWDGERVTVLDLEWARFAPAWTDLARLIDTAEEDAVAGRPHHTQALVLLREAYPELFAVPDLDERLRRYRAAYQVREVFLWPPIDEATAPADHPVRILRSLVF